MEVKLSDRKLRVAIIGTGGICHAAHLPSYALIKDRVEVVALCDLELEKARWMAREYAINPDLYVDYRDILIRSDIDAVDICTPNYMHAVIAIDALQAGKHVFCEKPDAVSVADALKMQQAAEERGKTLMVMRNNRHLASSRFLKNMIETGQAGEIYAGRCGWIRRRGIPGKGGWFTTRSMSGGGPLIDLGVHMIDLAVWLMGNPRPIAVSGCTYRKFAENTAASDSAHAHFGEAQDEGIFDVEDLAMGFIRFDNGACLQIEFSWASNIDKETNFVELRGDKAGFYWRDGKIELFKEEQGYPVDIKPWTDVGPGGHERNIMHFADVLLDGVQPDFLPEQGVNMIRILTALYQSAETGREVMLHP